MTTFLGRSCHRVIKIDTDVLGVNAAYTVFLLAVVDDFLPGARIIYILVVPGQAHGEGADILSGLDSLFKFDDHNENSFC